MTIEDKITELLADAAPLRLLEDDDADKAPLAGIIDQINVLRARQSAGEAEFDETATAAKKARTKGAA